MTDRSCCGAGCCREGWECSPDNMCIPPLTASFPNTLCRTTVITIVKPIPVYPTISMGISNTPSGSLPSETHRDGSGDSSTVCHLSLMCLHITDKVPSHKLFKRQGSALILVNRKLKGHLLRVLLLLGLKQSLLPPASAFSRTLPRLYLAKTLISPAAILHHLWFPAHI